MGNRFNKRGNVQHDCGFDDEGREAWCRGASWLLDRGFDFSRKLNSFTYAYGSISLTPRTSIPAGEPTWLAACATSEWTASDAEPHVALVKLLGKASAEASRRADGVARIAEVLALVNIDKE